MAVAALAPTSARAGPCAAEIDQLQAAVDARIDTTAGTGRTARESTAATAHRQPTPGSVAQAEQSLGEGSGYGQVLASLAQAIDADQAGDATSCERALGEARSALER
ncbi:hypothetical protein JO965_46400 (plasmid) [Microvirga sp. VF16]|nr:hypothetical protein JO965_46400 [Microvirga sp. VF16]